ncbi:MAG: AbiV family abortive infection protein [Bacteroidetes bacterium]|nr:AbiV family abortive infection protein [Bacteroidota bacterium]
MADKTLTTLTQKECCQLYKALLKNSNAKWDDAEILAGGKSYGTATTLTIISIEELIKGLIVFLDSEGFQFRKVKGMHKLFKDHRLRYWISYVIFAIGVLGDDLFLFFENIKINTENTLGTIQKMNTNKHYANRVLRIYIYKKVKTLREELILFSMIDELRQDGLYCDYSDNLKNPLNVSENEYSKIRMRLSKVKMLIESLILSCENQDGESYLSAAIKEVNPKPFYQLLESALKNINDDKNSFGTFRNKLDNGLFEMLNNPLFFYNAHELNDAFKEIPLDIFPHARELNNSLSK